MTYPKLGERYTYAGSEGVGAQARIRDPELDNELPAEMRTLDLAPLTVCTVDEVDTERDLIVVAWTDAVGTPRRTSIDPDHFTSMFDRED